MNCPDCKQPLHRTSATDANQLQCIRCARVFVKQKPEAIHHPDHYGGDTPYEAIKVIRAWMLGFSLGNAVKYICRAGRKGDTLEDLKKARWYLDEEIKFRESSTASEDQG